MFGHGQIEGYAEKYGMEFKKPLWDESENQYLVDRHYRQIFPLLHHRALFAGVENFRFYDFLTGQGVDENVFAYSNHMGNEYALVVYNNKFSTTGGNIHFSTGISTRIVKNKRKIVSTDIASALNIKKTKGEFTIMQDIISTQEFIFETHSLVTDGLHLELSAYKTFVFMHIRQVADDAAPFLLEYISLPEWKRSAKYRRRHEGAAPGACPPSLPGDFQSWFLEIHP